MSTLLFVFSFVLDFAVVHRNVKYATKVICYPKEDQSELGSSHLLFVGAKAADGEAEAKACKECLEWCDDAATCAKFDIETATTKKAKLDAKIQEGDGEIEAAGTKNEELCGAFQANTAELKGATESRNKKVEDFTDAEAELMEASDTPSRAITILTLNIRKIWQHGLKSAFRACKMYCRPKGN